MQVETEDVAVNMQQEAIRHHNRRS